MSVFRTDFRWREEQLKRRSDHVASSLRSRPANVETLGKKVSEEHGMLHEIYHGILLQIC